MLEFCKQHAPFHSAEHKPRLRDRAARGVPIEEHQGAFRPRTGGGEAKLPPGQRGRRGRDFSTLAPISLYGATKLASEALALEYGATFSLPVFINRCGVLAGAGQFGRADQGIFAYWINAWLRQRPLKYIGFGGNGYQVRDCLHPRDLLPALAQQLAHRVAARTESRFSPARGISDVAEAALRRVARRTSARTRSASIRAAALTFGDRARFGQSPRLWICRTARSARDSRRDRALCAARIGVASTCRRRCEPLDSASNS